MTIRCSKCKQEKSDEDFCSNKSKKSGKDSMCKECRRTYNNSHAEKNREKRREKDRLYYSKNVDIITVKHKYYYENNRETIKIREREYRHRNKDRNNKLTREWQKRNPERAKEIRRKTVKKTWEKILASQRLRRETNPKYRIMNRMRSSFKGWLSGKQKTCSVMDLVCMSKDEFINYIESQFSPDMTWSNIHIDHYVPLSYFNPENENDMTIAWHYLNLRPLLGIDNLLKNDTLPSDYKEHIEEIKKRITTAST